MKHADGREYVLVPKVATEEMCRLGWDIQYMDRKMDPQLSVTAAVGEAYKVMVYTSPPYEPADEVVERTARAIMNAGLSRGTEYDMALAAIRAFIGRE